MWLVGRLASGLLMRPNVPDLLSILLTLSHRCLLLYMTRSSLAIGLCAAGLMRRPSELNLRADARHRAEGGSRRRHAEEEQQAPAAGGSRRRSFASTVADKKGDDRRRGHRAGGSGTGGEAPSVPTGGGADGTTGAQQRSASSSTGGGGREAGELQSRYTLCYCSRRSSPRSPPRGGGGPNGYGAAASGDSDGEPSSGGDRPGEPRCLGPFCLGRYPSAAGCGRAAAASPGGRAAAEDADVEYSAAAAQDGRRSNSVEVVGGRAYVAGTPAETSVAPRAADRITRHEEQLLMLGDRNEKNSNTRGGGRSSADVQWGAAERRSGQEPLPDHINITFDFSHFELHGLQVSLAARAFRMRPSASALVLMTPSKQLPEVENESVKRTAHQS